MNNPQTRDDDERSSIANSRRLRGAERQPPAPPREDPEPLQKPEGLGDEQRRHRFDNRSTPGRS